MNGSILTLCYPFQQLFFCLDANANFLSQNPDNTVKSQFVTRTLFLPIKFSPDLIFAGPGGAAKINPILETF